MIIDANTKNPFKRFNQMHIMNSRQCGKTNMNRIMMEAYFESYITGKPVEVNFGMVKVNIKDLEDE